MRSCCQLSQHQGVLHLHSLLMVCWHQGQRRQDVPAAAAVASESESNCREMGRRHMQQPVAMGTAKPIKVCCTFTASSMVCWHSTGSVYLQQQQQHQCQTAGRLVCVCEGNSLLLWVQRNVGGCRANRGMLHLPSLLMVPWHKLSGSTVTQPLLAAHPVTGLLHAAQVDGFRGVLRTEQADGPYSLKSLASLGGRESTASSTLPKHRRAVQRTAARGSATMACTHIRASLLLSSLLLLLLSA